MIAVFPIAKTEIDWAAYLTVAKHHVGTSVSECFDKQGISPSHEAYLLSLDFINDYQFSQLKHLSFSFFCVMLKDSLLNLVQLTNLEVTIGQTDKNGIFVAIVTGTLQQWKDTVIACSVQDVTYDMRKFGNLLQQYFESIGLGQIWSAYKKHKLLDTTYTIG